MSQVLIGFDIDSLEHIHSECVSSTFPKLLLMNTSSNLQELLITSVDEKRIPSTVVSNGTSMRKATSLFVCCMLLALVAFVSEVVIFMRPPEVKTDAFNTTALTTTNEIMISKKKYFEWTLSAGAHYNQTVCLMLHYDTSYIMELVYFVHDIPIAPYVGKNCAEVYKGTVLPSNNFEFQVFENYVSDQSPDYLFACQEYVNPHVLDGTKMTYSASDQSLHILVKKTPSESDAILPAKYGCSAPDGYTFTEDLSDFYSIYSNT